MSAEPIVLRDMKASAVLAPPLIDGYLYAILRRRFYACPGRITDGDVIVSMKRNQPVGYV
jgi:hypothetical protein